MAITKTVMNVDSDSVSISNWKPADKSDFVLIDTMQSGENREAIYQRVTDDDGPDQPQLVRVGYYPKSSGGKRSANLSVKAGFFHRTADSVLNTTVDEPFTVTLAITGPNLTGGIDATDALSAIMNTVSWLMPGSAGALGSAAASVLKFGVVNTLNTLAD